MEIVICGGTCSGKSSLARRLSRYLKIPMIETGYFVKKMYFKNLKDTYYPNVSHDRFMSILKQIYNEKGKDNITKLRINYIKESKVKYGKEYFIHEMIKTIDKKECIVVGIREQWELELIKNSFDNCIFIYLYSNEKTLTDRFYSREEKNYKKSNINQLFFQRRNIDKKGKVDNLKFLCDVSIDTSYMSKDEVFETALDYILRKEK